MFAVQCVQWVFRAFLNAEQLRSVVMFLMLNVVLGGVL